MPNSKILSILKSTENIKYAAKDKNDLENKITFTCKIDDIHKTRYGIQGMFLFSKQIIDTTKDELHYVTRSFQNHFTIDSEQQVLIMNGSQEDMIRITQLLAETLHNGESKGYFETITTSKQKLLKIIKKIISYNRNQNILSKPEFSFFNHPYDGQRFLSYVLHDFHSALEHPSFDEQFEICTSFKATLKIMECIGLADDDGESKTLRINDNCTFTTKNDLDPEQWNAFIHEICLPNL